MIYLQAAGNTSSRPPQPKTPYDVRPTGSFLHRQSRRWAALLLSLAAHASLGLLIGNGGRMGSAPHLHNTAQKVPITIRIVKPDEVRRTILPSPARQKKLKETTPAAVPGMEAVEKPAEFIQQPEPGQPASQTHGTEVNVPLLSLPEPRYFPANELSERPNLVQNIPPEKAMALPDAPPYPGIVRLLINEQGDIDKVVFEDTSFSEDAKRFVSDSFSAVKFKPGKIGDLAVKSQLMIEVSLERVLSKPMMIFISGPSDKGDP